MKLSRKETSTSDYYTITGKRNNQQFSLYLTCEWNKTNYGFRHQVNASLWIEGKNKESYYKNCYYNRTWENYTFQTTILGALKKLKLDEKFIKDIDNIIKEKRYNPKCYQYLGR